MSTGQVIARDVTRSTLVIGGVAADLNNSWQLAGGSIGRWCGAPSSLLPESRL
jgi:hypothetical protein